MRNTSILTVLALGAAVLAVSCQKNVNEQEPVAAAGSRTFTCVIANPDTKVAVSDAGKTTWEVGDEIVVHGESDRMVVTLTADDISSDGKTATITVEGITPYDRYSDKGYTSTFYACYPASAVVDGNLYYYARFSNTNNLLMAAYNVEDTFVFYNLCGVISFKASGDFDSYTFTGNNGETVGYSHYQVQLAATDNDPDLRFNKTSDPGTSGPLTSISGSVVADGKTVNYIGIPMGADFTKGFSFKFKKDGAVVKTATTATAVNLDRNKLLPLGDITSKLETYVPPTTSDHKSEIPTKSAVDLSANGSANSYIISAPGIYKLPALKGNSEDPAGSVFGVELLWETYNDTEEVTKNSVVKAVDFEDNWIYIEMPSTLTPGNALIAAKNAEDDIIWSWHLWIPSTAITNISDANYSAKPAMSRNLGALVDATIDSPTSVQSFGLLYEWGRKDPFPGLGVTSGKGAITVAGIAMSQRAEAISLEDAIKNPTTYVCVSKGDWLPTDTEVSISSLWGETSKTVYDPCPPGYMLPARDKSCAFWSGSYLNEMTSDIFTLKEENGAFTVGTMVFPLSGYIDDGGEGQKKAGTRTIVWSGRWDSGTVNGYGLYGYTDDGIKFKNMGNVRSRGGSVRCVAD